MATPHHIKVKIGTDEFEASGDAVIVGKQYDDFKAMVAQRATPMAPVAAHANTAALPAPGTSNGRSKLSQVILDAVFRKGEPLSLTDRPKTDNADADALLMLVYGHTEMIGQSDVTAATLAKSSRQTGLKSERIGRAIDAHSSLIKVSGAKKGTRYGLNNLGIAEAEKLIVAMAK